METLTQFLRNRCFIYEGLNRREAKKTPSTKKPLPSNEKKLAFTTTKTTIAETINCIICGKNHNINTCGEFLDKTTSARFQIVKDK